jgi:uncharacterized protein (TIGR02284 family)
MKSARENTIEVFNDLIRVNNDRIAGYEKAAKEAKDEDADLRELFNSMADESRDLASALSNYVQVTGEKTQKGTSAEGKIYRAWMDIKATFTGNDRKAILASCEAGEDAAQRAYEKALEDDLSEEGRQIIIEQKNKLRRSHDKIKRLRDVQHVDH